MVNREQVLDVPLVGKGFARKTRGGPFVPGEYRNMRNCEILEDGSVRNRRSIRLIPHSGGSDNPVTNNMRNINGFVGHYRSTAVSGGKQSHKWYGTVDSTYGSVVKDLWSPATMNLVGHDFSDPNTQIIDAAFDWRQVVGFFKYNKICYWLVHSYLQTQHSTGRPVVYLHILWAPEPVNGDLTSITFASLAHAVVYKEDLGSAPALGPSTGTDKEQSPGVFPQFKGFFIFKDRLWVYTQKTIIFSKATDPTIWITPDGGFFNFNEDDINDVTAYRDTLYVICDNRVYALTYTADPNAVTSTTLRMLVDGQGGDSCVLFRDTVYFARDDSLFSVSDQTVTRVRDLDFFQDVNPASSLKFSWKLAVFGDYIVLLARQFSLTTSVAGPGSGVGTRFPALTAANWYIGHNYYEVCTTTPVGTDLSNDVLNSSFFLNMDNGSVHVFDSAAYGYLQDVYISPVEDSINGQQQMFLLYVNGPVTLGAGQGSGHWAYYMKVSQDDTVESQSYDAVFTSTFTQRNMGYALDLEFWVDIDGDEFWVKRFRQIFLEAVFCQGMSITYAYDNELYTTPVTITGPVIAPDPVPPIRPPYHIRLNMNQKARQVLIRLFKPWVDVNHTPFEDINLSYLMLNKLQLTYSYSNRGPQRSSATVGKD